MNIAVVGLGNLGWQVAQFYAQASVNYNVYGYDVDQDRLASLRAQASPVHICDSLEDCVGVCSVIVILVPVKMLGEDQPDLTKLYAAVDALALCMPDGALVILESTVPVGTTANVHLRFRELGVNKFNLAYSPERVSVDRVKQGMLGWPKVISAISLLGLDRVEQFYTALGCNTLRMTSPEAAELVKIAEGVYRQVNIGIASELSALAYKLRLNFDEIRAAANSQPYCKLLTPTLGIDGYCIPLYYKFINSQLGWMSQEVILLNRSVRLSDLYTALSGFQDKTILLLGMAYRPNVAVVGQSIREIADMLALNCKEILVCDPLFSTEARAELGTPIRRKDLPKTVDAIIIGSWHDVFKDVKLPETQAVLDCRSALTEDANWAKIFGSNVVYIPA